MAEMTGAELEQRLRDWVSRLRPRTEPGSAIDCMAWALAEIDQLRATANPELGVHRGADATTPPWPLCEGEDDAEVWIPLARDCKLFRYDKPCPHCGSATFHMRTRRCGDCGRRPEPR